MTFTALLAAADRAATAVLGGPAITYAPTALTGEPSVSLTGIFQNPDVQADVQGATVMSTGPAVFIRLDDLGAFDPEEDDDPTITVAGTRYKIRDVQKDGEGGAFLHLQRRDEAMP